MTTTINQIPQLVCPDWCSQCQPVESGGCEHVAVINLGIGVDGYEGEAHICQVVTVDTDEGIVSVDSTVTYLGNGGDARLTSEQCRSIAAKLLEVAAMMERIDCEVSA